MHFDFTKTIISVCSRARNQIADSLAAYGASLDAAASDIFMDYASQFVTLLVSSDKPGASV